MSDLQIIAGTEAKKDGHLYEQKICSWLNDNFSGVHVVEGGNKTKVDIVNLTTNKTYSLKSVSKNHTQCHLTSTSRWCEYFDIDDFLRHWYNLFFGIPGEDVSKGKSKRHRLTSKDIDDSLNELALNWFNTNKVPIFDVIIHKGMYNTPVNYLVWNSKKTNQIEIYEIDSLRQLVYNGEWILKPTTLHFLTKEMKKLFHLQMKGSGEKYTSGYHGLMFHIHKCF
jgi:hypothetical protein